MNEQIEHSVSPIVLFDINCQLVNFGKSVYDIFSEFPSAP